MRLLLSAFLLLASCTSTLEKARERYRPFEGERIDIMKWGEIAFRISVSPNGEGRFETNEWPLVQVGGFALNPDQYADFVSRIEPYKVRAEPFSSDQFELGTNRCSDGKPKRLHIGGIVVRWVDDAGDKILRVELGCPSDGMRPQDKLLLDLVMSYRAAFVEHRRPVR